MIRSCGAAGPKLCRCDDMAARQVTGLFMAAATRSTTNHSADVDLWMDCGPYGAIPLSQASYGFVIAATARDLPACIARIILTVDGRKYERTVRLVNGLASASRQAAVLPHEPLPF